jgi:carbon-monoxide dehydrogenase catalytic subunit
MIEKAAADGCETIFGRAETMKPCPIGAEGSCCKQCGIGPCRAPTPKKKEGVPEKAKRRGLCGATAETIAARNFSRMVAAGAAAHSDDTRGAAELFLATAKGEVPDYQIKDEQKFYQLAMDFGDEIFKGKWAFEPDPVKAARMMIEHIDKQRKALGIDKARERILLDMAKRRELEAA